MGKNSKKQFRRNEKTYRGHHNLDKFLNDKKLQRKPIAKDGSCLFRAVAEQVFSSQSCHQKVRMQCVEYIQTHQDDFKEFITVSIPEYLELLKCELWGGEVELVVLSRLYDRSIIVYNEAGGLVHEQVFQSSEDQASTQQNNPIMLAYSGGNHYDSVYSTQHMKDTAFCQGLVYEMLFCRVMRDPMPLHCQHRLTSLNDSDIEMIKKNQESSYHDRPVYLDRATHLLSTHYKIEELESLGSNTYHNTALDVHKREKASIERHDRRVAASIQFQRGDAVIFNIGGKEMEGEIAGLNVSQGCHLVYMHKSNEEWAIPAKDIAPKPLETFTVTGKRNSQIRPKSQQQQQQQQNGAQASGQKGQQSLPPQTAANSESSKAQDTPTVSKDVPSNKKQSAQGAGSGVKSREGKRGSVSQPVTPSPSQQQQTPPKVVPPGALPAPANRNPQLPSSSSSILAPPSTAAVRTPTPDTKPQGTTSSSAGVPRTTSDHGPPPSTTRRGVGLSRSAHSQVRSHLGIKSTPHPSKATKRTDAGSLDSDDPTSSSGEEASSPTSPRDMDAAVRTGNKLPTYYEDDCWSAERGYPTTATTTTAHTGQRKTNTIATPSDGKQPVPPGSRVSKSSSAHSVRSRKDTEVKVQNSKSADLSKTGLRQPTGAPAAKADMVRGTTTPSTNLSGKQRQQRQQRQTPHQQLDTPSTASLLLQQQQSPIQGLIDGPNSGPNANRDGRESPPYLDRQIPRDPSSQPQDSWPLFEEVPQAGPVSSVQPVTAIPTMMLNAARMGQHLQQQAPPPSAPPPTPGASGASAVVPSATLPIATAPLPSPPLVGPTANLIPVCLLPLAETNSILTTTPPVRSVPHQHHHQQQQQQVTPTPPQSPRSVAPLPEKLQASVSGPSVPSAVKPQAAGKQQQQQQPPHSAVGFHQAVPAATAAAAGSPPATITSMPSVFHSLMHPPQGHPQFVAPSTAAMQMQQLFRSGGIPPPHHGNMEMYNQLQGQFSRAPPSELVGAKPTPSVTPLITPLQPLSTVKSPTSTERAAMSPLLVTAYTQTMGPKVTNAEVQTDPKKTRQKFCQARPSTRTGSAQTEGKVVSVEDLRPPSLQSDSRVALVDFAIRYSIQCLNMFLQYCNDDATSVESLSVLEALAEQRLKEHTAAQDDNQPTALNASQHDFLVSLTARDKMAPFPFPFPVGMNPAHQQLKLPKEAMPTHLGAPEGEDTVLPQTDASLPGVGRPPLRDIPSGPASQPHPHIANDDKPSDHNVDVTPLQEVQPPPVAAGPAPFPVPPMMMAAQRPPYMMPMPMFYNPGFYPPSFAGMPGMPGVMMPPYGHHMIPQSHPVMQQQQQQATNQQEQSATESVEESSSASSLSTKLTPPPPPPSALNASQPIVPALSVEVDNVLVSAQSAPVVDSVESSAVQQVDSQVLEDYPQTPSADVEIQSAAAELPSVPVVPTVLEDHHQSERYQEPQTVADIPLATDIQPQLSTEYPQSETPLMLVDADTNISSNPGLPCRGTSVSTKLDVQLFEDDEIEKTEVKQQKHKGSRSKQHASSQENTSKQGKGGKQQSNYQRSGTGNTTDNAAKSTAATSSNQAEASYNKRVYPRNQRPQQQFTNSVSGRRYHTQISGRSYQGGGGGGRFAGGNGNGRYQRYGNNYQGGQQNSSSEHVRPHNPSRKVYASGVSGGVGAPVISGHNDKTVTPIPATNNGPPIDSGDRDVSQCNLSTTSTGANNKSSLKNFTSYPTSPHTHTSSMNGEITGNTSGMVVPQSATDARGEKGSKNKDRWHFKDNTAGGGEKLEFPDPNTWNWRQTGFKPGDYAETVEDPFINLSTTGNEQEFAFKDVLDEIDEKQLEEYFPALKTEIPGRYDPQLKVNCPNPPAQCTNRGVDAKAWMLTGGSSHAYNLNK